MNKEKLLLKKNCCQWTKYHPVTGDYKMMCIITGLFIGSPPTSRPLVLCHQDVLSLLSLG